MNNGLGQDKYNKTRQAGAEEGGEGACLNDSGALLPFGRPRDGSRRHLIRTQRRAHRAVCVKRVDLPVVLRWVRTFR